MTDVIDGAVEPKMIETATDVLAEQRYRLKKRRDEQDTWRQHAEREAKERAAEVLRLDALLADIDRSLAKLTAPGIDISIDGNKVLNALVKAHRGNDRTR